MLLQVATALSVLQSCRSLIDLRCNPSQLDAADLIPYTQARLTPHPHAHK